MERKRHFLNDKGTKRFFRLLNKAMYHMHLHDAGYPDIHAEIAAHCIMKAGSAALGVFQDPAYGGQKALMKRLFVMP